LDLNKFALLACSTRAHVLSLTIGGQSQNILSGLSVDKNDNNGLRLFY